MLVEDAAGFFDRGRRGGRYQLVEVGHDVIDTGSLVVVNAAHVASGDDTLEFVVGIDDRETGKSVFVHDILHLGKRHVLGNREGLGNDRVFEAFHAGDHSCLHIDEIVAMDDSKAAFPGEGDCQFGLGHCVHGGRENGNLQIKTGNKLGAEIGFTREDGALAGQQEHVVKT